MQISIYLQITNHTINTNNTYDQFEKKIFTPEYGSSRNGCHIEFVGGR